MKLRKMLAMVGVAVMTTGLIAGTSYAATKMCYNTELTRIGNTGPASPSSGHRIEVKGGSCGFPAFFGLYIHEDLGDAGLATVLTAFSLGNKITLKVPANVAKGDMITGIHMDK